MDVFLSFLLAVLGLGEVSGRNTQDGIGLFLIRMADISYKMFLLWLVVWCLSVVLAYWSHRRKTETREFFSLSFDPVVFFSVYLLLRIGITALLFLLAESWMGFWLVTGLIGILVYLWVVVSLLFWLVNFLLVINSWREGKAKPILVATLVGVISLI